MPRPDRRRRREPREEPRAPLPLPQEEPEGSGDGERVRLNKFLADQGIASRRHADALIAGGKVTVNDRLLTALGTRIDPERDVVEVDGVRLKPEVRRRRYYLLSKPRGVVCTNEVREARPRAIDLIDDPDKGRIYTVGRLDEESEGLILLTNDGEFTNLVAHPRYGVPKTYLARVRGRIDAAALERLRSGVHLAEGRTAGARVRVRKRASGFSILEVTLREGKNREVRRIFAQVGFEVLALKRTHVGPLSDRRLKPGQWRPLLRREVEELLEVARAGGAGSEAPRRGGRGGAPRAYGRPPRRPRPRGGNAGGPRGAPGAARGQGPRARRGRAEG